MATLKQIACLAFVGCALTIGTVADARLAANKLAANKLAANKLAANRLAANKLAANKLAANKLAANGLATTAGEGAFYDVTSIQLADGTQLTR